MRLLMLALLAVTGCAAEHVVGAPGLLMAEIYRGDPLVREVIAVAAADFDGDGHADVALLDSLGQSICFLPGLGDGTLAAPRCSNLPLPFPVWALGAAHFGATGPAALLAAGDELALFSVRADGGLDLVSTKSLTSGLNALLVTDVNSDGFDDALVAESSPAAIEFWIAEADRTYAMPTEVPLSATAATLAYQDLDGDGRPDLATASGQGIGVYRPQGLASVDLASCALTDSAHVGLPLGDPVAIAALDVDGDGATELVVAERDRQGLLALHRQGEGELSFVCSAELLAPLAQPAALLSADFDGDDILDLLAVGADAVLLSGGAIAPLHRYPLLAAARSGTVVDLDGDGRKDAVLGLANGSVVVLRNAFLPAPLKN